VAPAPREFVEDLAALDRVDRRDKLAVRAQQVSEETLDQPEELEQLEILVCTCFSFILPLKFHVLIS